MCDQQLLGLSRTLTCYTASRMRASRSEDRCLDAVELTDFYVS